MKRFVKLALAVSLLCSGGAICLGELREVPANLPEGGQVASAGEIQAALQADQALVEAVRKGDKAAVDGLLDAEFTWTDRMGRTRNRANVLDDLATIDYQGEADTRSLNDFGQVALITGTHQVAAGNARVRFARIWVKRAAGWRALVYQETTIAEKTPAKRAGFGSPSGGAPVECDNPCKSVPYHPEDKEAQTVVAMWQAVERTVLTNDVDGWIPNFTDDFLFVTPDGGPPLDKADRIAMIKELKRTNTTLIPAQVESMQVWVLGDAAVMRSAHKPLHGKTLHITRVFSKKSGHWQIAFGQQTWME
jgi:ketosteroid isomerase-like protein